MWHPFISHEVSDIFDGLSGRSRLTQAEAEWAAHRLADFTEYKSAYDRRPEVRKRDREQQRARYVPTGRRVGRPGKERPPVDPRIAQALELVSSGESRIAIARELDVTVQQIDRWVRKAGKVA